jgi:hypothetical protein
VPVASDRVDLALLVFPAARFGVVKYIAFRAFCLPPYLYFYIYWRNSVLHGKIGLCGTLFGEQYSRLIAA